MRYILWDGVSTFARTRRCSKKYVLLVSNVFSFFFVQRWGRQGGVVVSIDIIIIIKNNKIIISIINWPLATIREPCAATTSADWSFVEEP